MAAAQKASGVFASAAASALGYLGLGGAAGYGIYFAMQQKEISKLEKEVEDVGKLVEKEKKALTTNATLIQDNEERIRTLGQQQQRIQADVSQTESKLQAAQQEVQRLEAELKKQNQALSKAATDSTEATSRLARLRAETDRLKEGVTLGEKSLAVAREKAANAKSLLNPLNHPLLKKK